MKREEVWRRGGSKSGRTGGRRMTGSAFKAMDVVVACLSYEKGGGLEEGGLQIGPGPEAGGFSLTRA
jgi:hypothetical protein